MVIKKSSIKFIVFFVIFTIGISVAFNSFINIDSVSYTVYEAQIENIIEREIKEEQQAKVSTSEENAYIPVKPFLNGRQALQEIYVSNQKEKYMISKSNGIAESILAPQYFEHIVHYNGDEILDTNASYSDSSLLGTFFSYYYYNNGKCIHNETGNCDRNYNYKLYKKDITEVDFEEIIKEKIAIFTPQLLVPTLDNCSIISFDKLSNKSYYILNIRFNLNCLPPLYLENMNKIINRDIKYKEITSEIYISKKTNKIAVARVVEKYSIKYLGIYQSVKLNTVTSYQYFTEPYEISMPKEN